MSIFHLEIKFSTLCTAVCFILLIHLVTTTDDISNHIKKCCNGGKILAEKQSNCESYEYDLMTISPIWRGLCHSTYGVCCSHELEKQYCLAGRLAALTGSRCSEQYNNTTTAYSDCCRACQVGLAVKASGNICNDTFFSYFSDIESFRVCCGGDSESNRLHKNPIDQLSENNKVVDETTIKAMENLSGPENGDGTIILQDDDDDICGKFPLCEHICENTLESYVCKCHSGFMLNDDMVTCSAITTKNNNIKDLSLAPAAAQATQNSQEEEEEEVNDDTEDDDDDEIVDITNDEEITCPPGFQRDPIHSQNCVDIDECLLKLNDCKTNQYCSNTNGSFRCLNASSNQCELGFEYNKELQKCTGIKTNYINRAQSVLNNSSSSGKRCQDGFEWKIDECIDINECQIDDAACDSSQVCFNDNGGYHCDCKIGFNLDTTTNACVDINECSINNHNCLPTQRCDNTVGSYVCTRWQSCGTGYTLNADSSTCDDNDECALNTHNCKEGWDCYNTKGSFRCYRRSTTTTTTTTTTSTTTTTQKPLTTTTFKTNPYYKYYNSSDQNYSSYRHPSPRYMSHQTSSRQSYNDNVPSPTYYSKVFIPSCSTGLQRNSLGACVDINECSLPNNPCSSQQRCINTNGSYRCQNHLECPQGYKANSEASSCIDIDECETGEHNCIDNQLCHNRNGGFLCTCLPGYHLSRLANGESRCVDINECEQRGAPLCPMNAQCINTIGSYFCECKSGYQKSEENERICLDVDECNEIPGLCHQKCVNFFGGYRCTCNNGYELGQDNRTCIDVDECEVQHTHKLCMGFCNNVPGSYECSCPRGYTLASDRNTCLDIDECATREFCTGRNDVCTNKRGGYKCTTIHCPFGYTNDPDQKTRCRLINNMCEGEDCYNKPSAYTHNFITFVSKLLVPPEGRTFFSLKGPEWYDNIEFDMKIVKIQAAANIEKASYNHFGTSKGHHEVHLSLKRSLEGPQEIEIDLTMTVFTRGLPRGKSVAKVFIIVSQYTF